MAERLVVALGGNAIAGERGADPESQRLADLLRKLQLGLPAG